MAGRIGSASCTAGLPSSLQSCSVLIREAITWPERLPDVPGACQNVCRQLSRHLSELEQLSDACRISVHSRTGFKRVSLKASEVEGNLMRIRNYILNKGHRWFPSVMYELSEQVVKEFKELLDALESLREDAEIKRLQARREGDDYFLGGRNYARRDGPDIALNFESREENGKRRTFEGQLLDTLLASSSSTTVTACAHGYGGVGKTCALRGIAHHPEVEEKFWGGVLYGTLGQNARKGQLRGMISEMVKSSGGIKTAAEILVKKDFEEFVICAGQWFEPFPCLFLIDDVWLSDRSDVRDFELVRNLARHPLSRVVFTTRDSTLKADKKILFEHRKRGGEDSRLILLKTAGFEAEPKLSNAAKAFKELLQIGNGLPLKLALIGGGVRKVVDLYCMSNPENAWVIYCEAGVDELENEKDILMRSLSFLDQDSPDCVHYRHFKSLSILRYAQSVKIGVACRMWGMSRAESRVEAELLGRYHIVRLTVSATSAKDREITVSLHDDMLNIARQEARKDDHFINSAQRVVYSYLGDARGPAAKPISVSCALEHFVSDTRFGLDACGVVCVVGASLEEAHLYVASKELKGNLASCDDGWPTIENDGYIYENLCWLLSSGKLYALLEWLISEPQWLICQLNTLGVGHVQGDLDVVAECFSRASDPSGVDEMKRCVELMILTVIQSKADLISSEWKGMPWFQLYGRLSHFAEQSDWVRRYIGKIERLAPRPWYKPSVGCLLPASMSLQETISVDGWPECVALVDNIVFCCCQEVSGNIILQKYDLSRTTDCDRVVLCKSSPHSLRNAAMSKDARTVVLCLTSGDILLCHLDLEAQHGVLQTSTLESRSNRPLARIVGNVVRRGEEFTERWTRCDFEAQNRLKTVGNHEHATCVALSENGEIVVTGSDDKTLRVWKMRNEEWESSALEGHTDWVNCVSMSTDGTQIVSGSDDKTVRVWKMRNAEWESIKLEGHRHLVTCVSVNVDGTLIVSGSADKTVRVWKLRNAEWESTALEGHTDWLRNVSVSADGTQIVSGSEDRTARVWKMKNGEWESTALEGHTDWVRSVSMSADGTQVVSGSEDRTVRMWKMRIAEWESTAPKGHTDVVSCVSVSASGMHVVSGSDDKTVRLWSMRSGEWESTAVLNETDVARCVSMSADGTLVLSRYDDKIVQVWEMTDGEWESTALEGHYDEVHCVSVSADGTQIVSGSKDRTVRVWSMRNGEWESTALEGHTEGVNFVLMSADGTQIVSGSDDKTVRVWRKKNGKWESTALEGHTDPVLNVTMSADGSQIVSGSDDKTVRVWRTRKGEWDEVTEPIRSEALKVFNFAFGKISLVSKMHFPVKEIYRIIWPHEIYRAHSSYFFEVPHYPYLVRIDEVL